MMTDTTKREHHGRGPAGPERHESRILLNPGEPVELTVSNSSGDVIVRATERADVLVTSIKHGRPDSRRYEEAKLTIIAHDNRIGIHPHVPGGSGWAGIGISRGLFKRGDPGADALDVAGFPFSGGDGVHWDFEIEIPLRVPGATAPQRVKVHTASGEVLVEDVLGQVGVNTASGDARLRAITGDLTVNTAGGDVRIERPAGRLTARTASGDVRITEGDLDRVSLVTVSGDLGIESALRGAEPSSIQTVSGDVDLALRLPAAAETDAAAGATLTFQSVSGDAAVEPLFRKVARRTWRVGSGDDGGPRIAVKTVSGDLQASAALGAMPTQRATTTWDTAATTPIAVPAPPAPPASPAPPAPITAPHEDEPRAASPWPVVEDDTVAAEPEQAEPPVDDAARLEVLQALERGEIDIDEALNRLDDSAPESPPV